MQILLVFYFIFYSLPLICHFNLSIPDCFSIYNFIIYLSIWKCISTFLVLFQLSPVFSPIFIFSLNNYSYGTPFYRKMRNIDKYKNKIKKNE